MKVNKEQAEKCRDLGATALRQGDYERAVKMLEKSLQLYPLPGVEALLSQAKAKKDGGSSESNGNSNTGAARRSASMPVNGNSNHADSAERRQSGLDGRSYTNEQILIVKKVLRAKEGGRGAHYRVLEISNTATESEIKKAYRKLSLKVHPDKVRERHVAFDSTVDRAVGPHLIFPIHKIRTLHRMPMKRSKQWDWRMRLCRTLKSELYMIGTVKKIRTIVVVDRVVCDAVRVRKCHRKRFSMHFSVAACPVAPAFTFIPLVLVQVVCSSERVDRPVDRSNEDSNKTPNTRTLVCSCSCCLFSSLLYFPFCRKTTPHQPALAKVNTSV